MKTSFWAFLIGIAVSVGGAASFATGNADNAADETCETVFLGELDLAEQMEIWRNQYRRMTPGDEPLVQDVGTWPAAWEEFSPAWDGAPATRDLATWLVPIVAERSGRLTVLRDVAGNALWSGATDFAKDASTNVTLTGALVSEEDWAAWRAVREEIDRRQTEASRPVFPGGMRGTNGPHTNGLRFTNIWVDTNGDYRLDFAWETNGDVQVFCRAMQYESWTNYDVVWTNDENEVITNDAVNWCQVEGERFNGTSDTWDLLGVATITNDSGSFTDTNHVPEYDRVRFYATAALVDTDGDGLTDGEEWLQSHSNPMLPDSDGDGLNDFLEHTGGTSPTNPDSDGDGVGDAIDTNPYTSNVWWIVKTTNTLHRWVWLGTNIPPQPQYVTNYPINGNIHRPTTNCVVHDVKVSGFVDDILCVDGNVVGGWDAGTTTFEQVSVTNQMTDLQSGVLNLQLWDLPEPGHPGDNEVKLGNSYDDPFRVEWEWWLPMDFRLEHITTNGSLLVVNPSGTRPNREITCMATVLPEDIPDSAVSWSCTEGDMAFTGGVTNGRIVHLTGTQPGDWEVAVSVEGSTLPPAKLRGKVLEKKTVMVYLHIVREDDGTGEAMSVGQFQTLLAGANQIHEQSAIEFQLAPNVSYIDYGDWLDISTNNNSIALRQLQSCDSHTGGIEVYCVRTLAGPRRGANLSVSNETDGLTIEGTATAKILAHELGHACGLKDVYTSQTIDGNTVALLDISVLRAFNSKDWCEEAPNGGYGPLHHPDLVRRLLMNSFDDQTSVDIPRGNVWGVTKDGRKAEVPVGLQNMSRQPSHW